MPHAAAKEQDRSNFLERFFCDTKMIFPPNFGVLAFGVEHNANYFYGNQTTLKALIHESDFVGVENDWSLSSHLPTNELKDSEKFSDLILKESWRQKKPIVCTDPLSETLPLALVDTAMAFGGLLASTIASRKVIEGLENEKVTRREFLFLAISGLGSYAALNSKFGHALLSLLKGCDGTSTPEFADKFSYLEFRNAMLLLGYLTLGQNKIISSGQAGVQFIGAAHPPHYASYLEDGIINMERVTTTLTKNSFYQHLVRPIMKTSARVWIPNQNYLSFDLHVRYNLSESEITPRISS